MASQKPRNSAAPTTHGISSQEINDELEDLQHRGLPDLEESYEWASEHYSDSDGETDSDGESSSGDDSGNEAVQQVDDPSEVPEIPEGGEEEFDLY